MIVLQKTTVLKWGFLYKEHGEQKIKPEHTYWFLHRTFQEYLAAFYLTEKVKRQRITVDKMIGELKDNKSSLQVLKFVSGILHKNDAVHHMEFVEKVGKSFLGEVDDEMFGAKERTLDLLCAYILSESSVNKDIAGIIRQFLPEKISFDSEHSSFRQIDAVYGIMPRLLNLICTKDGVNREVYIDSFALSKIVISASELTLICEALTEKLKVRKLEFGPGTIVDDEIVEKHLTYGVEHSFTNFTTKSTKFLAKALCQSCNLKELYFIRNSQPDVDDIMAALTPDPLPTDMAAFRRGSVLHTLVLQGTGCDEQHAFAAAKMLRTNKSLEMSWCSLGSKGVAYIAEALKSNRTLNCLCLPNSDWGGEGAAALADMLCWNETLTELFISSNEFGEDGAVALADALRVNNSSREIHLSHNNITDEGFKCLAEAFVENTALETLCAKYPGDGLAALDQHTTERVKERIDCKIIHCHCHYDCDCDSNCDCNSDLDLDCLCQYQ